MKEQAYREEVAREGFGEPKLVEWAPGTVNESHIHEETIHLYMLSGELTLTTEDWIHTCRQGESFTLAAGMPHREEVGPEGARFLAAKK